MKDGILYIFLVAFSFTTFLLGAPEVHAWLDGYSHRKVITVDATNIDSNLTDFPLYIDISSDTDIGGGMQDTTNYYDIRFTNTSDTLLPYEEEAMSISAGSATGSYWIKSDVSSTTGATIYMYYGKSGASDGSQATTTWNSGFQGVWHLSEGDSTASDFYKDSTDNDNDGTLTDADGDVASVAAQIANGLDIAGDNGESDVINVGNDTSLDLGSTFTLSGWVNMDDFDESYSFIIAKDVYPGDGSYDLGFKGGKPYVAINDGSWGEYTTTYTLPTGSWHHIAGVRNSSNEVIIYVDGVATSTHTGVKSPQTVTTNTTLGLRSIDNYEYDGTLDEVRIESVTRSAEWVKFMVANSGGEADHEISFGSEQENVDPTVSTLSPADNATDVSISTNLVITFDESVATSTGNITLKKASDDSIVEAFDVSNSGLVTGSGTTYTINPTSDFSSNTEYYIHIDATAFDDTSGNSYAGISDTTTWNFTTVAEESSNTGSSSSSGGVILGFLGTQKQLVGPWTVQPRQQIIYPDGTIVYLYEEEVEDSAPAIQQKQEQHVVSNNIGSDTTEEDVGHNDRTQDVFVRNLREGDVGVDVRKLQEFLNRKGFTVSAHGNGAPGKETDYFGSRTWSAVVTYQETYAAQILSPLGLTKGTGIFGPSTRKHVNSKQ